VYPRKSSEFPQVRKNIYTQICNCQEIGKFLYAYFQIVVLLTKYECSDAAAIFSDKIDSFVLTMEAIYSSEIFFATYQIRPCHYTPTTDF
jgi:hypothetical protein